MSTNRIGNDGLGPYVAENNGPSVPEAPAGKSRPSTAAPGALSGLFRRSPPAWAPSDRYVASSSNERAIRDSAASNAIHRKVPQDNRFTTGSAHKGKSFATFWNGETLTALTKTSRLDLHGHGNISGFSNYSSAAELAQHLQMAGLKEVGVLKLQACDVGKGDYLQQLKNELTNRGIKVGYISAPVGTATDVRIPAKIAGREFNIRIPVPVPTKSVNALLPEKFGLKTIKGNIDVRFPGTRYDLPKDGTQTLDETNRTSRTNQTNQT